MRFNIEYMYGNFTSWRALDNFTRCKDHLDRFDSVVEESVLEARTLACSTSITASS